MAVRKAKTETGSDSGSRKKNPSSAGEKNTYSWIILFWLVFAIFIFGLFIFNRETITNSIQAVQNEMIVRRTGEPLPPVPVPEPLHTPAPVVQVRPAPPAQAPIALPPVPPPAADPAAEQIPPTQQVPVAQPVTPPQAAPQNVQPQPERVDLRERGLYFIQVDRGGSIRRIRVNRNLPVSTSPMTDVIQALLAGPNEEERNRGLISLIPPGTRMLSATVRGNTAYISFSEDFQYNTYGIEGYASQLRQIVFTATEFPNIRDVQILIEGRRHDFLGEGIWIGSPISREML